MQTIDFQGTLLQHFFLMKGVLLLLLLDIGKYTARKILKFLRGGRLLAKVILKSILYHVMTASDTAAAADYTGPGVRGW